MNKDKNADRLHPETDQAHVLDKQVWAFWEVHASKKVDESN